MARRRIHGAKRLTAPGLASVMLIACKAAGRGRKRVVYTTYYVDKLARGMMVQCDPVWGRRATPKAENSNVYRGSCRTRLVQFIAWLPGFIYLHTAPRPLPYCHHDVQDHRSGWIFWSLGFVAVLRYHNLPGQIGQAYGGLDT